jgi:hypothetical protein
VAYVKVSPLGGSRDKTWRRQGIRKRSVSWNLPKLSQLWRCNGGFGPRTTKTQNAFLFPVYAIFRNDCPLAVEPASTPRRLVHKKTWRESTYWHGPLRRDHPGYCTAEVGHPAGIYELPCTYVAHSRIVIWVIHSICSQKTKDGNRTQAAMFKQVVGGNNSAKLSFG